MRCRQRRGFEISFTKARGVEVKARCRWNDTRLDVVEGQTIKFETSGRWKDWTIECDADGYERSYLKPFARWRRAPGAPWFALIGAIGRNLSHTFVIGQRNSLAMPATGRLFVFANDVPWAYFNNSGLIDLSIEAQMS